MTTTMVTKLRLQFKKGEGAHNLKVANFAYVNESATDEDMKAVGDALGKLYAYPLVGVVRNNAIALEA